jgi:hypothetical protein
MDGAIATQKSGSCYREMNKSNSGLQSPAHP